jgi:hypothetical protein
MQHHYFRQNNGSPAGITWFAIVGGSEPSTNGTKACFNYHPDPGTMARLEHWGSCDDAHNRYNTRSGQIRARKASLYPQFMSGNCREEFGLKTKMVRQRSEEQ